MLKQICPRCESAPMEEEDGIEDHFDPSDGHHATSVAIQVCGECGYSEDEA